MIKNLTIFLIIILFLFSCKKIKYYPDKSYHEVRTMVLAHRAGGSDTSLYRENSFEAAIYSFSKVDGIEVDIQISKSKTIWLSHNINFPDCENISNNCIPEMTDNEINNLDICNGDSINFTKLESIFAYMSEYCNNKYISLDVKAWNPCSLINVDVLGLMNVIGEKIIELTGKYKLQNRIIVESETSSFLNFMKKRYSGIDYYLTSYGDFERALLLTLESDFDGISFKFKYDEEITQDHIQLLRRKGLKIQLWTVDSEEDIIEALQLNPDFIQTGNLTFFENL